MYIDIDSVWQYGISAIAWFLDAAQDEVLVAKKIPRKLIGLAKASTDQQGVARTCFQQHHHGHCHGLELSTVGINCFHLT